jgi:hypothetical protein
MINIISTFYISNYSSHLDKLRSIELEKCLIYNMYCPYIEKIHLFVDDQNALIRLMILMRQHKLSNNSDKVIVIQVGKKPKYIDFFNYILEKLTNKICMIINADIFLYKTNNDLIENLKINKIAYALTRHEYNMSTPLMDDYRGSHDAYIFNSKFLDKEIINKHTDFFQNVPGIETHIIKALCDIGFTIQNPCKQIQIIHLHKTQLRNHGKWIGLHKYNDMNYHRKSCWWVPPVIL